VRVNKILGVKVKNNHIVHRICNDSRKVRSNDIFFAINGSSINGENYIAEAIHNGALTIVTENYEIERIEGINYVIVKNVRKSLAKALKRKYAYLLSKITFIGVTGTNGKTTTTTLIYKYLRFHNIKCTLIGSNGIYVNDRYYDTINTTPDITVVYDVIQKSSIAKSKYIIMEVSSHAIKQLRVFGIPFKVVLFTNLTLDHLDFHYDFMDYKYTKSLLLNSVDEEGIVILNKDIEYYSFFENYLQAKVYSYGIDKSDYWIRNIILKEKESSFNLVFLGHTFTFSTNLIGEFNVYNVVSFIAILNAIRCYSYTKVCNFLKEKIQIPGRMEEVNYQGRRIIIDYAHTPDGVFNVLSFLKSFKKNIILVIGCGGSRDKTKRRVIGQISVDNSDYVIFTSDNPRDEDEKEIIKQIVSDIEKENYEIIVDRYTAIKKAIDLSQDGDIVAILGRGNEQFQKVKGQLIPLNDIEVVKELIRGK